MAELREVEAWVLRPGDTLVLRFSMGVSEQELEDLRARAITLLPPDVRVLVTNAEQVLVARAEEA